MDQWTLWLSLLSGVAMTLLIMPNVLRLNQGRMLRNIALWLAVFVLLGWVYKAFGPFGTVAEQRLGNSQAAEQQNSQPDTEGLPPPDDKNKSFDPPQE